MQFEVKTPGFEFTQMGASLFSENEPRPSCVLDCVHLRNGRNGLSFPAVIPLWVLLPLNILFCLVAALIYSLKSPSSSFYGGALVSQTVAVRQYVQEKLVTYVHTSGWALLPAGLSWYEPCSLLEGWLFLQNWHKLVAQKSSHQKLLVKES